MKVLFDQGTPAPLRKALLGHQVETANECGWSGLQNGELIDAAEKNGFEIFVTTDRSLKYQQNLVARRSAIVVLLTTSWPRIRLALAPIVEAVNTAAPGTYREIDVPRLG